MHKIWQENNQSPSSMCPSILECQNVIKVELCRLTVFSAARLADALVTSRRRRSTALGGKSHRQLVAERLVENVSQHRRVVRTDDAVCREFQRIRKCSLCTPANSSSRTFSAVRWSSELSSEQGGSEEERGDMIGRFNRLVKTIWEHAGTSREKNRRCQSFFVKNMPARLIELHRCKKTLTWFNAQQTNSRSMPRTSCRSNLLKNNNSSVKLSIL